MGQSDRTAASRKVIKESCGGFPVPSPRSTWTIREEALFSLTGLLPFLHLDVLVAPSQAGWRDDPEALLVGWIGSPLPGMARDDQMLDRDKSSLWHVVAPPSRG